MKRTGFEMDMLAAYPKLCEHSGHVPTTLVSKLIRVLSSFAVMFPCFGIFSKAPKLTITFNDVIVVIYPPASNQYLASAY
jgi:hypothetical protein